MNYEDLGIDVYDRPVARVRSVFTYIEESNHPGLCIYILNACGIRNKLENPDFIHICQGYGVLCFNESKIENIDTPEIEELTNRHKPTNWRSGGVLLAVSKMIASKCVQTVCANE